MPPARAAAEKNIKNVAENSPGAAIKFQAVPLYKRQIKCL